MAGTVPKRQSRLPAGRRRGAIAAVLITCVLAVVGLSASAALASGPAQDQYKLNVPSAGSGGGDGQAGSGGTHIGGSSGDSAVPILLIGVAAIGSGAAALVYLRRRRGSDAAT